MRHLLQRSLAPAGIEVRSPPWEVETSDRPARCPVDEGSTDRGRGLNRLSWGGTIASGVQPIEVRRQDTIAYAADTITLLLEPIEECLAEQFAYEMEVEMKPEALERGPST